MSVPMNERRDKKHQSATRHGASFFTSEQNNIGLKLMKQLGWNENTGLGKYKQGTTQYIKSKYKADTLGIGTSNDASAHAVWSASQILYNDVLQRLKSATDTNGMIQGNDTIKSESDEQIEAQYSKSAALKQYLAKRELYGKYKKSKQTSNYDATSMSEIFGKNVQQPAAVKTETVIKTEQTDSNGLITTSKLSITDYFKQQQQLLKQEIKTEFNAQSYYDQMSSVNDTLRSHGRIGLGFASLNTNTNTTLPPLEPPSPKHKHTTSHTNQSIVSTETSSNSDSNESTDKQAKKRKKHKKEKKSKKHKTQKS